MAVPVYVQEPRAALNVENEEFPCVPHNAFENLAKEVCWYHLYFKTEHFNFVAFFKNIGCVCVSLCAFQNYYRVILWLRETYRHALIPTSTKKKRSARHVLEHTLRQMHEPVLAKGTASFVQVDAGSFKADLRSLEEEMQPISKFKFGVVYARPGQHEAEDVLGNDTTSLAFQQFLNVLGTRVRLRGFQGYAGQLHTNDESDGGESVYTTYCGMEVMFHVAPLIPNAPDDVQHVHRKKFIATDVAVIVFYDGTAEFDVSMLGNNFTHVFAVVQPHHTKEDAFRITVHHRDDMPHFGPETTPSYPRTTALTDFLLCKLINGIRAASETTEFLEYRARKTDEMLMQAIRRNHPNANKLEGALREYQQSRAKSSWEHVRVPPLLISLQTGTDSHSPLQNGIFKLCRIADIKRPVLALETMRDRFGVHQVVYSTSQGVFLIAEPETDEIGDALYDSRVESGGLLLLEYTDIVQLGMIRAANVLVMRHASKHANLGFFRCSQLLSPEVNQWKEIAHTSAVTLMIGGSLDSDDEVLITVEASAVAVYKWEGLLDGTFVEAKRFAAKGVVAAMTLPPSTLWIGVNSAKHASFYSVDLTEEKPTPVLIHTERSARIIGAFKTADGALLCYDSKGVFVSNEGVELPLLPIHWRSPPLSITQQGPYIIAATQANQLEVWALNRGAIYETHNVSMFDASVSQPMVNPYTTSRPVVFTVRTTPATFALEYFMANEEVDVSSGYDRVLKGANADLAWLSSLVSRFPDIDLSVSEGSEASSIELSSLDLSSSYLRRPPVPSASSPIEKRREARSRALSHSHSSRPRRLSSFGMDLDPLEVDQLQPSSSQHSVESRRSRWSSRQGCVSRASSHGEFKTSLACSTLNNVEERWNVDGKEVENCEYVKETCEGDVKEKAQQDRA